MIEKFIFLRRWDKDGAQLTIIEHIVRHQKENLFKEILKIRSETPEKDAELSDELSNICHKLNLRGFKGRHIDSHKGTRYSRKISSIDDIFIIHSSAYGLLKAN